METKLNVIETKCSCVNVVRKDWDAKRHCFKYTLTMKPVVDGDDVFAEDDLFADEFQCPVTDMSSRNKFPEDAAKAIEGASDDVLAAWDSKVRERYNGKVTTVKHCTVSVEYLTDGKYSSYDLEIPGGGPDGSDVTYNVSTRNLCALGSMDEAIGRARNQVLRKCKEQYEGGEA